MRTTALAALAWLVGSTVLLAQPSWEGGILVGGANYKGDLTKEIFPEGSETHLALGIFGRHYLSTSWALRTNLFYGQISGDDTNFSDPLIQKRGFRFKTRFGEAALLAEWDPLGKRRFSDSIAFRKTVSPFLFAGAGVGYMDPEPDFGPNEGDFSDEIRADLDASYSSFRLSLPAGLGLKFDLSERTTLATTLTAHYFITDYLDGISESANPDANDWLFTGGLSLSFRFAPKDTDKDGIADKEDSCPWLAGAASAKGCPDVDGDGVEDAEDVCPETPGLLVNNGCPDTDGDGFMDLIDKCPDDFGFEETEGCPDRDNDCIADADDLCPDREGLAVFQGCPDTDGDGFPDPKDPCPLLAGLEWNGGCPLPDTDCDGVLDRDDYCPQSAGLDHPLGCPDLDEDGLADYEDSCPELAGLSENNGCPDLEAEEKELIAEATKSIQFRTGSAILLAQSKEVLNELAELLQKYPYYEVRIKGHTDNTGDDKVNLRLSEKRAEACYEYLMTKGISPKRMTFQGYGEEVPIADNDTESGRRLNRRVEFEMYVPEES